MAALQGILWQEYIVFKRKIISHTLSSLVTPILYLIAFGWGLGSGINYNGVSYLHYIIPGILAMNTMMVSFSNTANSVNISRLYYKTFENYMVAPLNMTIYVIGKTLSGALYGVYSGSLIIVLTLLFKIEYGINLQFILILLLNCFVFSGAGLIAGLIINTHAGMFKFMSFVITPMSFLCGTFFSVDKMPMILNFIVKALPLTHTTMGLRNSLNGSGDSIINIAVLLIYFGVFTVGSAYLCRKVE